MPAPVLFGPARGGRDPAHPALRLRLAHRTGPEPQFAHHRAPRPGPPHHLDLDLPPDDHAGRLHRTQA